MRNSGWTPSIVPGGDDETVYLVKDDLGRLGAVWREADAEATDLEHLAALRKYLIFDKKAGVPAQDLISAIDDYARKADRRPAPLHAQAHSIGGSH
jgi:hypothetical protein